MASRTRRSQRSNRDTAKASRRPSLLGGGVSQLADATAADTTDDVRRDREAWTDETATLRAERWGGTPPLSRREVIERLRELHGRGMDRTADLRRQDRRLFEGVLRHFGSVPAARAAARLPAIDRTSRWSRQELVDELRRLHAAGVRLTKSELEDRERYDLLGAIHRLAGGMTAARRIAGVPEPEIDQRRDGARWSADLVIDEIRDRHARGESLAMSKVPRALHRAATKHYGSWQAAIEAAGIDYARTRLRPPPRTEDEMIDELRALSRQRPDWTRGEAHDHPSVRSARRAYGSLEAALAAAGIEGWPRTEAARIPDRDAALARLRQRHALGAPLNVAVVQRDDSVLYRAICRHFGSWDAGIRTAGLPLQRRTARPWTADDILAELRARHARGDEISARKMAIEDAGLYKALTTRFGGIANAARAAGVPFTYLARGGTRTGRKPPRG